MIKPVTSLSSPSFLSTSCLRYGLYLSCLDCMGFRPSSSRSLADTQDRGVLDLADFSVAMYLIQATMSGQLSFIPTSLPPGLYEQAGGNAVAAHATGSSGHPSSPLTSALPSAVNQTSVHLNYKQRSAPVAQTPAVPPFPGVAPKATPLWDVTPAEKDNADRLFDSLDSHKRGYIEGDIAVPFMLQSNLPEEVLAEVWCVHSSTTFSTQPDPFHKGSRREQRWTFDSGRICGSDAPHPRQTIRQGHPSLTSPNPRASLDAIERSYFAVHGSASSSAS